MNDIGQSSRGSRQEKILLIEDLDHQIQHLAEVIEKNPDMAKKLSQELDEVRLTKQQALKTLFGDDINVDMHCSLKHAGMAHLRGQEILNNISRVEPHLAQDVAKLNKRLTHHRDFALNEYLAGKRGGSCARCASDLKMSVVNSGKVAQSLNTEDGIMGVGDSPMPNITKALVEVGEVGAGQLLGQGGVYAAGMIESKLTPTRSSGVFRTRNLVNVGGGIGLALLGIVGVKNQMLKNLLVIGGTHMAAVGVVQAVQEATSAPAASYRTASFPSASIADANYGPSSSSVALY